MAARRADGGAICTLPHKKARKRWLAAAGGGDREPLRLGAGEGHIAPAGGTQTLHWLASTHLGVPVASSNSAGTATTLTGVTLLGFPGQTQTFADLYYNQYRDYDPTTGRYIQADPIGLGGDPNPYVYAGANPVGMVDPRGLWCEILFTEPDMRRAAAAECTRQNGWTDPNVLHVFGHGGPELICFDNGHSDCVKADRFLQRIRFFERFGNSVQRIKLWACNTGYYETRGFGYELAGLAHVQVDAPTRQTWWSDSWFYRGYTGIAGRDPTEEERQEVFENGREMHARPHNGPPRHNGGRNYFDPGGWRSYEPR